MSPQWFNHAREEGHDPKNRLKRIARESQQQDESQITTWLDLAKRMFDKDNDPDPQAA